MINLKNLSLITPSSSISWRWGWFGITSEANQRKQYPDYKKKINIGNLSLIAFSKSKFFYESFLQIHNENNHSSTILRVGNQYTNYKN
jgi:hypothetical protein